MMSRGGEVGPGGILWHRSGGAEVARSGWKIERLSGGGDDRVEWAKRAIPCGVG